MKGHSTQSTKNGLTCIQYYEERPVEIRGFNFLQTVGMHYTLCIHVTGRSTEAAAGRYNAVCKIKRTPARP